MQFQFEVGPPNPSDSSNPRPSGDSDLLRQILEVQREQVSLLRTLVALSDGGARWRAFVSRWREEFPSTASESRQAVAAIERAYINMVADLNERLRDGEELDNEFTLGEFLDRYGTRLSQLGTLLNLISPLADAAPAEE